MWTSSAAIPLLCCTPLFWCAAITGQEYRSDSSASTEVERNALKVLNDSDWAHTVKPSLQDTPCTYQHPAFPGLYPEDNAAAADGTAPVTPPDPVTPDLSEYLIRFQSARPVQAAIQDLLTMGDKWAAYGRAKHLFTGEGPTDL